MTKPERYGIRHGYLILCLLPMLCVAQKEAKLSREEKTEKAQEILSTYFEKHGGKKTLASLKTLTSKVDILTEGSPLSMSTFAQHRVRKRIDVGTKNQHLSTHIVFRRGGSVGKSMGEEKYKIVRQSPVVDSLLLDIQDELLLHTQAGDTLRYEGMTTVKREKCFVLSCVDRRDKRDVYYVSKKRGLIVRKREVQIMPDGNISAINRKDYEDYKTIDGFKVPFKVSSYFDQNNRPLSVAKVLEWKPNVKLDEALFRVEVEERDPNTFDRGY